MDEKDETIAKALANYGHYSVPLYVLKRPGDEQVTILPNVNRIDRAQCHSRKRVNLADVAIIGGGPAGLFAAELLAQHGYQVAVFDAKGSFGRKFLVAGDGGLNLTHGDNAEVMATNYGSWADKFAQWFTVFGPAHLRAWSAAKGHATYVGSSNRVFPQHRQALPLLQDWLKQLESLKVEFSKQHRWLGWDDESKLIFSHKHETKKVTAKACLLALGGASWPQTGSDGLWTQLLEQENIACSPWQAANCGWHVAWSDYTQPLRRRSFA